VSGVVANHAKRVGPIRKSAVDCARLLELRESCREGVSLRSKIDGDGFQHPAGDERRADVRSDGHATLSLVEVAPNAFGRIR
jgi:hypothetical protein